MPTCRECANTTDDAGQFCPACGMSYARSVELATTGVSTAATSISSPSVTGFGETAELSSAPASSLIGTTIDGFAIEAILGGGAFGTVFRGQQLGLDRPVAIKVPSFEILADETMAKRFAREARSAAKITHPGVVAIYAVGELPDGRPYLAMQLIDGQPLDKILEGGPVPAVRALKIARDIASALSETHVAGVVHRDLKPSNIMWRNDRHGDDRITIVDFGIAVAKPGNADATRLTTNGLIGTPHYMSPEQAQGEHADQRSDVYALGCILFELVTGDTPFDGSGFEVLLAHMGRPIPTPSDRRQDVPSEVDNLVRRLMQKRADNRPQSADEVVTLIDEALADLSKRSGSFSLGKTLRARRKTQQPTLEDIDPLSPTAALDAVALNPPPGPPKRARFVAIGAIAMLLVGAAGFAVYRATTSHAAIAGGTDARTDTLDPTDTEPSAFTGRRTVISDDGEMTQRTTLYDPIVAGTRVRTTFELWNAIGAPIQAANLVVTIEGPDGKATGVSAQPSKRTKGKFAFHHVFATPGHYVLRVFPPEAHSVFTVDLDVQSR
ncbi:MAG: serine/threonine-protein kinase [Kofleriaceae bacterium]